MGGIAFFVLVLIGLVGWYVFSEMAKQCAEKDFCLIAQRLRADPLNVNLHGEILWIIKQRRFASLSESSSSTLYKIALDTLSENPLSAAKAFALEVGRWHLGRCREDKQPTIYDEQAIQNDILVRCGGPAVAVK